MGTDASSRDSIKRAAFLLACPVSSGDFVILKLLSEPRGVLLLSLLAEYLG